MNQHVKRAHSEAMILLINGNKHKSMDQMEMHKPKSRYRKQGFVSVQHFR